MSMALSDSPDIDKKNLCYLNNENLKRHGVSLTLTEEQEKEIERVATDIIYFVSNYVKIVTLDDGVQYFNLYDYQKQWIEACYNHRFVIGKWSRQSGKCVSPDTKIRVKNKKSGEISEISIADLYDKIDQQ